MKIGSLFSGIGGLELGLERAGLGSVVWQAEIDPFCRQVLAKHWPDVTRYDDVRSVGHGAASVDVVCGGAPCQDVSLAGKRAGIEEGTRSGLWIEYARIIEELAPSIVVAENVLGLRTLGLRRVLGDLADLGFDAEWTDFSAAEVGAPHRRRRIFIVATHHERIQLRLKPGWLERACRAYSSESRDDGESSDVAYAECVTLRDSSSENAKSEIAVGAMSGGSCGARTTANPNGEGEPQPRGPFAGQWRRTIDGGWWPPVGPVRRVDDGIPNRSHGRRLKALGNAVVPQCAEVIGRAIATAIGTTGGPCG